MFLIETPGGLGQKQIPPERMCLLLCHVWYGVAVCVCVCMYERVLTLYTQDHFHVNE